MHVEIFFSFDDVEIELRNQRDHFYIKKEEVVKYRTACTFSKSQIFEQIMK